MTRHRRDLAAEMIELIKAAGPPVAREPYGARPETDAASDDDRRWFEDHPGAVRRYRPPYPGEFPADIHGPMVRQVVLVEVTQITPGVRVRHALTAPELS